MNRSFLFFAFCMLLFCQPGCDEHGDNYLEGSLVSNYHITFDGVRARLYSTSFSVEYMSDKTEGVPALRLTIDTDKVILAAGKTYDLVKYGSITRFEGLGSLPELESGEVTLHSFSETDGSKVSGEFHALLVTDAGVLMNVRGGFSVDLESVPI